MNDAVVLKEVWTNCQTKPYNALTYTDERFFASKAKPVVQAPVETKATFLVIDDHIEGNNLISFILKKLGYAFELVNSTELAVSRLKSNQYKLIFLDLEFCSNEMQLLSSINTVEKVLNRQTPIIGMQCPKSRQKKLNWTDKSLAFKSVINKSCLQEVVDVIEIFAKPQSVSMKEELIEGRAKKSGTSLSKGAAQELGGSLALLPGSLKTLVSCLNLAIEERSRANVVFLAASLQHSCVRVGLTSIDMLAGYLISEANANHWTQVDSLAKILNAKCTAAINYLESAKFTSKEAV